MWAADVKIESEEMAMTIPVLVFQPVLIVGTLTMYFVIRTPFSRIPRTWVSLESLVTRAWVSRWTLAEARPWAW